MDEVSRVDELLNQELVRQLEELGKTNVGSDDSRRIIDDFCELQKQAIEIKKTQNEEEKIKANEELEEKKLKAEMRFKKANAVVDHMLHFCGIAVSVLGFGVTIWNTKVNNIEVNRRLRGILKFEKTGSLSSLGSKTIAGECIRPKR